MINTIPFLTPRFAGGGFTTVSVPMWEREYVADLGTDMVCATFLARPDQQHALVKFELFDGDLYYPIGVVAVPTSILISSNDTGVASLTNVLHTYWLTLHNNIVSNSKA